MATARIRVLTDGDRYPGLGVPTRLAVRTDAWRRARRRPGDRGGRRGPAGRPHPVGGRRGARHRRRRARRGADRPRRRRPRRRQRHRVGRGAVRSGRARGHRAPVRGAAGVRRVRAPGAGRRLLRRRGPRRRGRRRPLPAVHRGGWWCATRRRARWTSHGGRATIPGLATPGVDVAASSSRTTAVAARPEAVVDGDERTAWSPAPDDTSPTLTVTLDEPADVSAVTLSARRGWMARYRPFVRVRLDGREQVVRASADGRLAVRGQDVRTVAVTVLPLPGRKRLAAAALEVEELTLAGHDLPRPAAAGLASLRAGPGTRGRRHHDADPPRRSALRALGRGRPALDGVRPRRARLRAGARRRRARRRGVPPGLGASAGAGVRVPAPVSLTAVPLTTSSPTHLSGTVGAGPQRLLALAMNHNGGWEATLDGVALTPVVVDGFRQGFVVPAGAAGALDVEFAPDSSYRWALGGGLLLALLLLAGLLVPDREPSPCPGGRPPGDARAGGRRRGDPLRSPWSWPDRGPCSPPPPRSSPCGVRRTDADWPVALGVVALVGGAGVLAAVTDPSRPTRPWVEAAVTLAVIAAGVLAGAAPVVPPSAWRVARRATWLSHARQQADRQPDGEQRHDATGEDLRAGEGVEPREDRQVPQEEPVRHRAHGARRPRAQRRAVRRRPRGRGRAVPGAARRRRSTGPGARTAARRRPVPG